VDDRVGLPDIGAAESKNFTYEVWFKAPSSLPASYMQLIGEANSNSGYQFADLFLNNDCKPWSVARGATYTPAIWGGVILNTNVCNGGVWHLVVTGNGSVVAGYGNGSSNWAPISIGADQLDTNRASLGARWNSSPGGYLGGSGVIIARIYPFALTSAQVQQNYNAGTAW